MGEGVSGMENKKQHGPRRRGALWLTVLLAIVALVAVNAIAQVLDQRTGFSVDLTADRLTQLSARTQALLDGLDQEITVTLVRRSGSDTELGSLLQQYLDTLRAASPHIHVQSVDPDLKPYVISALDPTGAATENTLYVATAENARVRKIDSTQLLYQRTLDGETYRLFCGDARFAGALSMLLDDAPRRAWFLTGHGETAMEKCGTFALALSAQGYEVGALSLAQQEPEKGDLLLVLSPQTDLLDSELKQLKAFLDGGGHLLAAWGADTPQQRLGSFATLLDLYGLGFEPGVVVESLNERDRFLDRPDLLCPQAQDESDVTQTLSQRLLLPEAVAVQAPRLVSGITATRLLSTSAKAYRKLTDSDRYAFATGDASGRQTLAVAADSLKDDGPRLLLLGSAVIFQDDATISGGNLMDASGNLELLLNCAAHLAGEGPSQQTADLKVVPTNLITFGSESEQNRVMALSIAALPLLVLLAGTVILLIRRKRAC